jgi:GTP cyclohydrolase II
MKVGDLVRVAGGAEYDQRLLGIVVKVFRYTGIRSVRVLLMSGEEHNYIPHVLTVINKPDKKCPRQ